MRQWDKQNVIQATQRKIIGQTDWEVEVIFKKKEENRWNLNSGFTQLTTSLTLGQHNGANIRCELWSLGRRITPGMWIFSPRTPSCGTRYSGGLSSGPHFWKEQTRRWHDQTRERLKKVGEHNSSRLKEKFKYTVGLKGKNWLSLKCTIS